MLLPAKVEAKEAKGYIVDFGFKDRTKGFLKAGDEQASIVGKRVYVVVKKVIAESKIIRCELLCKENRDDCV